MSDSLFSGYQATFHLLQVLEVTQGIASGTLSIQTPDRLFKLNTDTRTLQPGDIFVPLKGARFDGETYVEEALSKGASAAFLSREKFQRTPEWQQGLNLIVVEDPLLAYLQMARYHKRRCKAKVLALTGSSGKTTVKEMLYAALSPLSRTQCTAKNFNNEIGLCQTLLALAPETEVLILEMAMRGPGQIALLSEYAEPDVAMVINIGPAHIEFLGSLEGVAKAKCEITYGLHETHGILIVNADDPVLMKTLPPSFQGKTWTGATQTFSRSQATDIQAHSPTGGAFFRYQGHPVNLSVPGEHQVSNALAVLTMGQAAGFSPEDLISGLAQFQPTDGRMEKIPLEGFRNAWVINDAYNANPASMKASLEAFLGDRLSAPFCKRILVLGDMLELGNFSELYHRELGAWLGEQAGFSGLVTVGSACKQLASAAQEKGVLKGTFWVEAVDTTEEIIPVLIQHLGSSQDITTVFSDTILFLKGSRSIGLEKVPTQLQLYAALPVNP